MRIAFIGNFRPSFSTESHVSATMELLGHEVLRIQEDAVLWPERLGICLSANVCWWTCTWHTDFPGGHATLKALRDAGIPSVSHSLDLFVGLDREHFLDTDPFWRTRYVFTADGGHQEVFAAKGINHHWAPPGVYSEECYIAQPLGPDEEP